MDSRAVASRVVFGRLVDDSYGPVVRREITALTVARLAANGCYRYTPPFIAVVARGLDVSLSELGAAIAVTELVGLLSPVIGRRVDRISRRLAAIVGLSGVIGGTVLAGVSVNVVMFAAGLIVLALSKITYDVALGAWIADHVPYERRGRIVGLTETSWALGLVLGVSSMGAIAALTNWRWGYIAGATYVGLALSYLAVRVGRTAADRHAATDGATTRVDAATVDDGIGTTTSSDQHGATTALPTRHRLRDLDNAGRWMLVGAFGLMGGAQALFVTYGAWLEDEFGFGVGALAAVTFGMGALELMASTLSAARTDRWGKERSVRFGAGLMVPTGIALGVTSFNVVAGLALLVVYIAGFEFAIVSSFPIASQLIPDSPASGLGTLIAAGTLARGLVAVPATAVYERSGLPGSLAIGCSCALLAVVAITRRTSALRAAPAGRAGSAMA